jgi:uncharacterized protein
VPARSVRIVNASRGTVLAERAEMADSFWARGCGLLGRSTLPAGEGLLIVPARAVHCIGMAFPIDVVHLDRAGRVLKVVANLRPHRFGPLVWRSRAVVELPAGTAATTGTREGDEVELQPL